MQRRAAKQHSRHKRIWQPGRPEDAPLENFSRAQMELFWGMGLWADRVRCRGQSPCRICRLAAGKIARSAASTYYNIYPCDQRLSLFDHQNLHPFMLSLYRARAGTRQLRADRKLVIVQNSIIRIVKAAIGLHGMPNLKEEGMVRAVRLDFHCMPPGCR